MKKILILTSLLFSTFSFSQDDKDLSLARAGDFVLGIYLFIDCTPVNKYDYIGKIDKFNIYESDRKDIEKAIEKAKKKNPAFNGMIFKRDFKHVELILFRDTEQIVKGFKLGDEVVYRRYGTPVEAVIKTIDDAKERCAVEYIDENGEKKIDGVALKDLQHKQ